MEVPGKSATDGFVDDSKLYCQACYRDDILEPAFGFCQNCDEHLCESCYRHHRKPAPTRHHVLLDKDDMPKEQMLGFFKSSDETDFCLKHGDERVKFFCNDHNMPFCHICIALDHRLCKVIYIPDAAANVMESEEYRKQMAELESLKRKCQSTRKHAGDLLKETEVNHENILKEIRQFRKKVNKALDKMETDIIKKAEDYKMSENRKLEKLSNTCDEIANKVDEIVSDISTLFQAKHLNQLFLKIKRTHDELKRLSSAEAKKVWQSYESSGIEMILNQELVDKLSKGESYIGKLILKGSKIPPMNSTLMLHYTHNIPLEIFFSAWEDWFTLGIEIISSDKLMVIGTTGNTSYATLMDVNQNEIISEVELSSFPKEIKRIRKNQVAVTVENGVQIITLASSGLLLDHHITVGERFNGMACYEGSIFLTVGGFPGKVMMIDMQGAMLRELDADGSLFDPGSVAVSNDGEGLYVADAKHTITKMNLEGNVVGVYQGDGFYGPSDILEMTDGTFVICFNGSSKLARISGSYDRCEIAGLEETETWNPFDLTICSKSNILYALCGSSQNRHQDTIKAFQVCKLPEM